MCDCADEANRGNNDGGCKGYCSWIPKIIAVIAALYGSFKLFEFVKKNFLDDGGCPRPPQKEKQCRC